MRRTLEDLKRKGALIRLAALVIAVGLLLLAAASQACGQCFTDSVTDATPAIVVVLRPASPDPCPYCDDCDTSVFVGIPADTGLVQFTNLMGVRDWRLRIINGCNGMTYIDTCIVQAPNLHTVGFSGDWSHGGWVMQICGGGIAYASWKPGAAHGTGVIAPQPLPCAVLPWEEDEDAGGTWWNARPEPELDFPVVRLRTLEKIPFNQAPRGEVLVDPRRGVKLWK